MSDFTKRFNRSQKAAELRAKELEAEKNEYPLYYETFKNNDDYPFVKVAEFTDEKAAMAYVDTLITNESEF